MSQGVKASRSKAGRLWVLSLLLTSKCHGRKPVGIYSVWRHFFVADHQQLYEACYFAR